MCRSDKVINVSIILNQLVVVFFLPPQEIYQGSYILYVCLIKTEYVNTQWILHPVAPTGNK